MKAIIKSINEAYDDLQKRSVMYTRKTGSPGQWKYEYNTPHERKMTHEFHRITTMDEDALKRRAGKITDQEKMSRFFGIARASGKGGLAEHIKNEGVTRLKMHPDMFKSRTPGAKDKQPRNKRRWAVRMYEDSQGKGMWSTDYVEAESKEAAQRAAAAKNAHTDRPYVGSAKVVRDES